MSNPVILFRRAVRGSLGLRPAKGTTTGDTPELWRMGIYKATVVVAAGDGSTVDLDPEDPRLKRMQGVPLRQPFPGATIVPTVGSVVHVGWESGREDRVYALFWESGGASKVVIPATTIILDGAIVKIGAGANEHHVLGERLVTWLATHTHESGLGPTGVPIKVFRDKLVEPATKITSNNHLVE